MRRQQPTIPPSTTIIGRAKRVIFLFAVQETSRLFLDIENATHSVVLAQDPTSCDVLSDVFSGSCSYLFDGECDGVEGGPCPVGSDCADCQGCQAHNRNCTACIDNGCYWCPTDGTCQSQTLGEDIWDFVKTLPNAKVSSCTSQADWVQTCETDPDNFFTDPLYSAQKWAYDMMRVKYAWKEGYTGKGVVVRVNDPTGVAAEHPELSANFDQSASCSSYLPPDPEEDVHGTAVASLVVGGSDNDLCAVGIAPGATLSACVGPTSDVDDDPARFFLDGLNTTHISVNSWNEDACSRKESGQRRHLQAGDNCPFVSQDPASNPCNVCPDLTSPDCEANIVEYCRTNYETDRAGCAEYLDLFVSCKYNTLTDESLDAVTKGIFQGRNGKGIIYVFAAGNEYDIYEDLNMEGWLHSRFTITVGAVGKDETHASYSSTGAALFISGPGGDSNYSSNNIVASPTAGCTDATYGTSFSTPSVAGAIALMLEANPALGWRDVQGILASTARKVDADNPSWTTNGARLHHSNLYGFGVMDARAAVRAAEDWMLFSAEKQIVMASGDIRVPIPDNPSTPGGWTLFVNGTGSFSVESVVVYLRLEHGSRGDLEIVLTSPAGTQSVLHPHLRPENQHLAGEERWKLMTVRNYGEQPRGDWTITLTDRRSGNLGDCIDLDFQLMVAEGNETFEVNCGSIESGNGCADGTVISEEVDTLKDDASTETAREACCACGGGMPATDSNTLVSWTLVIYGHGEFIPPGSGEEGSPRSGSLPTTSTGRVWGSIWLSFFLFTIGL